MRSDQECNVGQWIKKMKLKCFGILLDLEESYEPIPHYEEEGFNSRETANEFRLANWIGQRITQIQEPWDKFKR